MTWPADNCKEQHNLDRAYLPQRHTKECRAAAKEMLARAREGRWRSESEEKYLDSLTLVERARIAGAL